MTKEEEADAEIGSTMSEGRNTMHTILSLEGQGTIMYSEEPQQVTDDDGRIKPSRDKCGTKDGATRRQE